MNTQRISLPIIFIAIVGWIAAGIMTFAVVRLEFRTELALYSARTWQMYASVLHTRLIEYGDSARADTVLLPPHNNDGRKLLTSVVDGKDRAPCDGYRYYNSDAF